MCVRSRKSTTHPIGNRTPHNQRAHEVFGSKFCWKIIVIWCIKTLLLAHLNTHWKCRDYFLCLFAHLIFINLFTNSIPSTPIKHAAWAFNCFPYFHFKMFIIVSWHASTSVSFSGIFLLPMFLHVQFSCMETNRIT